jgi:hypothetical protein
MGRELDSEMLRRLQENYREMSDGELLRLAAQPDDLTETARELLRGEMASRHLKVEAAQPEAGYRWASDLRDDDRWAAPATPDRVLGSAPVLEAPIDQGGWIKSNEAWLGVFHDAFEVDRACQFLEKNDVPFRLHDSLDGSRPRKGTRFDGPGVALDLIVAASDLDRAKSILRKNMGLFPLQEVEEADAVVDDGTVSVVGTFGRKEDAEDVEKALDEARIWHRITANPDGSAETEDAWTLEVREIDLVKAGDVAVNAIRLAER